MLAALWPKNWLCRITVAGLTNGTVSAIKCAVVMAPYRRCAKTPMVRVAISRWISPPGRSLAAVIAPKARNPCTVTDADDGENGPGSASDKLVARYVGKRGSIGVSNSPLPPSGPASTGDTPSAAGMSTAGMSWTGMRRHGSDVDHEPTLTRPRTANAKSWRHSGPV